MRGRTCPTFTFDTDNTIHSFMSNHMLIIPLSIIFLIKIQKLFKIKFFDNIRSERMTKTDIDRNKPFNSLQITKKENIIVLIYENK